MVHQALANCELLTDHNDRLAERFDTVRLSPTAGLLYPGNATPVLSDLSPRNRPEQLVILDGTWHHAKTLLRDIPRLRSLPRFQLVPREPGRYRIRREPNEQALATVEATAAALRELEPETNGIDGLLKVFDQMIDQQIRRSDCNHWRVNRKRRSETTNVPRVLTKAGEELVVAYGEQQPGRRSRYDQSELRQPVYWVAERLGSGEQFRCAIDPGQTLDPRFLQHARLSKDDFSESVSVNEFRSQWRAFLRANDRLVVYHPSTAKMLRTVDLDIAPVVILKSIKPLTGRRQGTLDQQLQQLGISSSANARTRAAGRLANAIAYTRWLQRALDARQADH